MIWVLSVHSIFANRCKLLESLVKHAKSMTAVCYPTDDEAATETHRNSFAAMLVPAGWLYDQSHGQWLKIVHWLLMDASGDCRMLNVECMVSTG